MTESAKYDAATVIRAQRRVLRVVAGVLKSSMSIQNTLFTDGRGLWTTATLLKHIGGVLALKVKK